jgi:hypothetical protein
MREAQVRRAKETDLTRKTKSAQFSENLFGAERQVAADVFEEDRPGSALDDDPADDGPQVALVVVAAPLACDAERLARVARCDAIHEAAPRSAPEGSGI